MANYWSGKNESHLQVLKMLKSVTVKNNLKKKIITYCQLIIQI